jgi:ABC-type bacteriocin/lantibiotic exporter with double-glycine peptidase domain
MMKNIIRIISRLKTRYFIVFFSIGVVYSFLYIFQVISPLFQKKLLDSVLSGDGIVLLYLLIFMGTQIGGPLISLLSNQLYNRVKLSIDRTLFFYYYRLVINQRKNRISQWGSGQYADMLFSDVSAITQSVINLSLFDLVFSVLQSIIVFFIVLSWSKAFSIVCLGYIVASICISLLFSKKQACAYSINRNSMGEMYSNLIDQLSNNSIVRTLSISSRIEGVFRQSYIKMQEGFLKILNLQTIPSALNELLKGIGFIVILVISLGLLEKQVITYGMLLAMISYYSIIVNPVNNVISTIQRYRYAAVSIKRLYQIELNHTEDNGDVPSCIPLGHWQQINLIEIYCSYEKDNNVLSDLSISFREGITGLVGLSGEGKTSLIRALCRDIRLDKGVISIDGINIDMLPIKYYLFKINMLPQDMEIFDQDMEFNLIMNRQVIDHNSCDGIICSIENDFRDILLTLPFKYKEKGFKKTQKWLEQFSHLLPSLELIGLYNYSETKSDDNAFQKYIEFLVDNIEIIVPDVSKICFEQNYVIKQRLDDAVKLLGLNKLKGRKLGSNGAFISGGEKQRLILGRFLIREYYDFVVLDEPFTNIDLLNEKELMHILKSKIEGKKGLLITHKVNVLCSLASNFYVMEEGHITQCGSHDDLVNQPGLYQKLIHCLNENTVIGTAE